jgi:hypothetical protein
MQVDYTYILAKYPNDYSIVKEFCKKNEKVQFRSYDHMIEEYEKYFDSLNLTYIEDEV